MSANTPPNFLAIADPTVQRAFLGGHPEVVEQLPSGTKLFKWTASITTKRGVSPWWQFLQARMLANGKRCPGLADLQTYAERTGGHNRDFGRARLAVTNQWNRMTQCVAIELLKPQWGFIGKAAGQRVDEGDATVFYIGGEYQVWIPGMVANDVKQISITPYLKPNASFRA